MTRSEIRDTLNKRELAASKLGQVEAKRYLESLEQSPTRGNIRAGLLFATAAVLVTVICMAL